MDTWQISNGDLVLGSGGFATLTGNKKVVQDLSCAVMEPYGSDPFHPGWGSIINNFVGYASTSDVSTLVNSELNRLVSNYISVQQSKMQSLANAGLANQYNDNEIISGVNSINATQNGDTIQASVSVQTSSGAVLSVKTNTNSNATTIG